MTPHIGTVQSHVTPGPPPPMRPLHTPLAQLSTATRPWLQLQLPDSSEANDSHSNWVEVPKAVEPVLVGSRLTASPPSASAQLWTLKGADALYKQALPLYCESKPDWLHAPVPPPGIVSDRVEPSLQASCTLSSAAPDWLRLMYVLMTPYHSVDSGATTM